MTVMFSTVDDSEPENEIKRKFRKRATIMELRPKVLGRKGLGICEFEL